MTTATLHQNGNGTNNGSLDFSHIACGESAIDRMFEQDGGFENLGHYVRVASQVQANRGEVSGSDAVLYRSWGEGNLIYRRWLSRKEHPKVSRSTSSPDGMYETSNPDGGATIPLGFIKKVWLRAIARDTPLSRARYEVVSTNEGTMPATAETSRADGSRWGGALSYWQAEAQQLQTTHPKLANDQYRLKKLTLLIPVTAELFEDAGLLEPFLNEVVVREFRYQTVAAMMTGNGVGRPLGLTLAPGTITVAKDPGQAAATVSTTNITNMMARTYEANRPNLAWFVQGDIQLPTLGLPVVGMTGYTGPQENPCVLGKPWIALEQASAIGTVGDVTLADFSDYLLVFGGFRKDISFDFKFDYHEGYLRFSYRIDGQPLWATPVTPPNSTITKSAFICLAAR